MTRKVVIFGTTEFGQVAHVYLTRDSPYEVAAFTVHERYITAPTLLGRDVVPFENLERSHPPDAYVMFVALGSTKLNRMRTEIYEECKRRGYELISYVSSKAFQWGEITVGDNCFVFEANVVQPFVRMGNNVIVWCGNHIGHHGTIEDNCFIASHAVIGGRTTIGKNSFVGVNATIRDGVRIGENCVIGAATVILKDAPAGSVYRAQATEPAPFTSDQLKNI